MLYRTKLRDTFSHSSHLWALGCLQHLWHLVYLRRCRGLPLGSAHYGAGLSTDQLFGSGTRFETCGFQGVWLNVRKGAGSINRGWRAMSQYSAIVCINIYTYIYVYRLLFTGFSHISLSYRLRLDTPRFWLVAFKATLGASGGDGFLLDVGISLWYWYNLYLSARVFRGFVSRGTAQQHLNLGHDSQGFDYSICFHFIKLVDPKACQNPQSFNERILHHLLNRKI